MAPEDHCEPECRGRDILTNPVSPLVLKFRGGWARKATLQNKETWHRSGDIQVANVPAWDHYTSCNLSASSTLSAELSGNFSKVLPQP